ncbi:HupE / UreJ protein [Massilia sp. PDC64]|nr:HupE/UreJ family protein [Massilia sp. PDC64]SDF76700.1 HupE / UreJ protein [Massilia sp. PDC64]
MKTATMAVLAAKVAAICAAILVAVCLPGSAWAHFDGRVNVRVVHFTYDAAGMTAYYRVSLAPLGPAPYVVARKESGQWFHYVDTAAVDPLRAARVLAAAHTVSVAGRAVAPAVLAAAVHVRGSVPPFATPAQARVAAETPTPLPTAMPDIGDVVLDAAVAYPGVRPAAFRFAGTLAPGKLSDAPLNTVLLSHRAGTTDQYRMTDAAIDVNPPWWLSAWQFIRAGAAHILEGFDHLLLVVCLVAADLRARAIALRITAFSMGHACAIAASFYGLLPDRPWLIPGVELLIALSVLGTALLMLGRRQRAGAPALIGVVGLVHGCGLAVGLRELLSDTGPNVAASLVSFNVGVEAGQLLVGAAVWLLLAAARRVLPGRDARMRQCVALGVAVVSLAWVAARTGPVWDALRTGLA